MWLIIPFNWIEQYSVDDEILIRGIKFNRIDAVSNQSFKLKSFQIVSF